MLWIVLVDIQYYVPQKEENKSSLTSKTRMLSPPSSFHSPFPSCSIEKITRVTSIVLVIHGTEDDVIDFSHGMAIYERAPRTVDPLWVEGAGHNDVELYGVYLDRLRKFITHDIAAS